jgi:hypothetical protein
MNEFLLKTKGTGVFLLTQNWYLEIRETIPTLVCISPNRIPGTQMGYRTVVIVNSPIVITDWNSDVNIEVLQCRLAFAIFYYFYFYA